MAHIVRASLFSPINKARTREIKARLQAHAEEKKMSELKLWLNKIRNAKLDEYPWSKYWMDFKKWA